MTLLPDLGTALVELAEAGHAPTAAGRINSATTFGSLLRHEVRPVRGSFAVLVVLHCLLCSPVCAVCLRCPPRCLA